MDWQDEQLNTAALMWEPEKPSKVNIPWEEIDKWIDSVSFDEADDDRPKVVDPGDWRN